MPYEPGMHIIFDALNHTAVVVFRDEISFHGPFDKKRDAYAAGEDHCRQLGWVDQQDQPFSISPKSSSPNASP
jgi:hypothetical protein